MKHLQLTCLFIALASALPLRAADVEKNGTGAEHRAIVEAITNPANGFNPETGTLLWKGQSFDIGDSRAFESRFERYLTQSSTYTENQKEYWEIINAVKGLLSPANLGGSAAQNQASVEQAYQLLYKAAEYPQDGGASRTLAHMIYNARRLQGELFEGRVAISEAERKRIDQEQAAAFNAYAAQRNTEEALERSNRELGRGRLSIPTTAPVNAIVVHSQKEAAERASQSAAQQAAHVAKSHFAVYQFQSQILHFIAQRRFDHALMATHFYRVQFKGSTQELVISADTLSTFLPNANLGYTVLTLEHLSQEAINESNTLADSARHSIAQNQGANALNRLQEGFLIGEHLQSLNDVPAQERAQLLGLHRKLKEAKAYAAAKDYGSLLNTAKGLQQIAPDGGYEVIDSKVQVAQQLSNLKLMQAKVLFTQNNFPQAQVALQEAVEVWPLNPQIATFSSDISNISDTVVSSTTNFDQWYKNRDYDAIFLNKETLGVGLSQDAVRAGQLKEVVETMTQVKLFVGQARQMVATGNYYGTWEALSKAERLHDTSADLLALKSSVLPHVQRFVQNLSRAEQNRAVGNYPLSFSYYQLALDEYPLSAIALEGQQELAPLLAEQAGSITIAIHNQ